jgi:hypothetical protein
LRKHKERKKVISVERKVKIRNGINGKQGKRSEKGNDCKQGGRRK